jgi:thymidine kinase
MERRMRIECAWQVWLVSSVDVIPLLTAMQVLDMVPVANSVTKLAGKCAYCSENALFSLRIAADERQALVGGADKYAPVCRHHYVSLNDLRKS